jgi:hypothetical protein
VGITVYEHSAARADAFPVFDGENFVSRGWHINTPDKSERYVSTEGQDPITGFAFQRLVFWSPAGRSTRVLEDGTELQQFDQ